MSTGVQVFVRTLERCSREEAKGRLSPVEVVVIWRCPRGGNRWLCPRAAPVRRVTVLRGKANRALTRALEGVSKSWADDRRRLDGSSQPCSGCSIFFLFIHIVGGKMSYSSQYSVHVPLQGSKSLKNEGSTCV